MTTVTAALNDLIFNRSLTVQEALTRHFTDDYRQRTDGTWSDRAEFAAHIEHLRTIVADGRIDLHEELITDDRYADRHTIHLTKTDGTQLSVEVYLFATHAPDGRFHEIQETTLLLSGPSTDRNIGSAR